MEAYDPIATIVEIVAHKTQGGRPMEPMAPAVCFLCGVIGVLGIVLVLREIWKTDD